MALRHSRTVALIGPTGTTGSRVTVCVLGTMLTPSWTFRSMMAPPVRVASTRYPRRTAVRSRRSA
ncbi:hypothetical protein LUR56_38000 [Streptomyces sp. MT29]|nr:hypothetical protein [Streptomyces sp. MT29]